VRIAFVAILKPYRPEYALYQRASDKRSVPGAVGSIDLFNREWKDPWKKLSIGLTVFCGTAPRVVALARHDLSDGYMRGLGRALGPPLLACIWRRFRTVNPTAGLAALSWLQIRFYKRDGIPRKSAPACGRLVKSEQEKSIG
jgi:hypothetical protein